MVLVVQTTPMGVPDLGLFSVHSSVSICIVEFCMTRLHNAENPRFYRCA